jgi:DNA-binding transcriptional ArsR family regulator
VVLAVGEWDEGVAELAIGQAAVGGRGGKRTARAGGAQTTGLPASARVLAAMGHPVRLKIMRKLLDGPATYATLRRLTRLQAGPLYHHVGALRLAGLIMPKERDLYELTRGGRNGILVAMTLVAVGRDRRRRPVAVE